MTRVDTQSCKGQVMPTTWTHCNVDIKILTKLSVDKAGDIYASMVLHRRFTMYFVDIIKHLSLKWFNEQWQEI